jgi:Golgi apparatus protein 1
VAPVESALALYQQVMDSPHRNYFLTAGMFFILIVFVFGLCFGRVTKRVRQELKNR